MEGPEPSMFDTSADQSLLDPSYDPDEEEDEGAWSFKSTIAFWCSVLFMNGSILFIVGAVCSLEGVLPAGDEYASRAMVDYPYFVGATFNFLPATYLVYFQVINKLASHGSTAKGLGTPRPLVFVARPQKNLGHIACLCNLCGAICYGISTGNMFINGDYTLVMDIPAIIGSCLFIVGAVMEGEYNTWRVCGNTSFYNKLPVVQAYCYTFGATLFLVGYVAMWDHWSGENPHRADVWTNRPFVLGSVFFLMGSICDLIMWKKKIYGLGFAKTLSPSKRSVRGATVDFRQQAMLWVYGLLMAMSQVNIGLYISVPMLHTALAHKLPHFIVELLIYTVIMFLASVIHTTPKTYPYNLLLWAMRFVAVIDFYAQVNDFVSIFAGLGYIDQEKDGSWNWMVAHATLNTSAPAF